MKVQLARLSIISPLLIGVGLIVLATVVSGWLWLAYFAAGLALYLLVYRLMFTWLTITKFDLAFIAIWVIACAWSLRLSWSEDFRGQTLAQMLRTQAFWSNLQAAMKRGGLTRER